MTYGIRHTYLFFLLAFLLQGSLAFAKTPVKYDSSAVQLRAPSPGVQSSVQESGDYEYDKNVEPGDPGPFARLLDWIFRNMWRNTTGDFNWWQVLILAVAVLVIVGIVLLLTRTDIRTIFFSKNAEKAETGKSSEYELDINNVNFPGRIADALRAGDFRLAVRLQFLQTLRLLSDKERISWRIDKTNHDYFLQLSGSALQKGFGELSLIYEYIWYGDFQVTREDYDQAQQRFKIFNSGIS